MSLEMGQFMIFCYLSHTSSVSLQICMHSYLVGFEASTRGYNTFSYSIQLNTKFILLINVKMQTIVGILTFMSMINTTSERLKARHFFICLYFSFYEQLKFRVQLS